VNGPTPRASSSHGSVVLEPPTRGTTDGAGRLLTVAAAAVPTVVVVAAVAASAKPSGLAIGAIGSIVFFLTAIAFPRWSLVAALFLLVAYVPDVVSGGGHQLASAALPLAVVLAVVVRHVAGVERVALPVDVRWFVFFGIALLVATAAAGQRLTSELSDYAGFAMLAAVMMTLVDSKQWLRRAMWAVVAGVGLLAALTVAQQLTKSYSQTFGGFAIVTPDSGVMRSGGPLSPGYFGQVLAAAAALGIYLALRAKSSRERSIAALATVLMAAAVVYTLSRGALLGIVAAVIAVVLLRRMPITKGVATAVVLVVAGIVVLPGVVRNRVGDLATLRAGSGSSDSSLRGRIAENLAAIEMFRDHPIIGVGPDNFELHYLDYAQRIGLDSRAEVRGAHNLYLESLAETGIVGTIPFFALLWVGLRRSWRARSAAEPDLALLIEGCFVAWLTFLVCAVALHISYPRYLWIFAALAFTAGRARDWRPA
jgi:O-antigen ligase